MTSTNLATVVLLVTMNQLAVALPVTQKHRFSVYTPYWSQGARTPLAMDGTDCIANLCGTKLNPPLFSSQSEFAGDISGFRPAKRSRNAYKTGWTMGGMPFSVLYMNPKAQMSVRSPMAESLRSLPPTYDNSEQLFNEPPPPADNRLDDYTPEVQAQALSSRIEASAPTMGPTRRQYSIIPQLFVSYGWGPLGK